MLVATISLLGFVSATNTVSQMWTNKASSCAGAPSFITIEENTNQKTCPSTTCDCFGGICNSYNACSSDSISTIASTAFGTKSYLQASKISSIFINLLILGSYIDKTCTTLQSTQLILTETCASLGNTSSVYVSSSGEAKVFNSVDCTGNPLQTIATASCVLFNGGSVKTSIAKGSSKSISIQSSFPSFPAILAAGIIYATFCL